jgi:hypothetical protein
MHTHIAFDVYKHEHFAEVGTFVLDARDRATRKIVAASAVHRWQSLLRPWAYVTLVDSPDGEYQSPLTGVAIPVEPFFIDDQPPVEVPLLLRRKNAEP